MEPGEEGRADALTLWGVRCRRCHYDGWFETREQAGRNLTSSFGRPETLMREDGLGIFGYVIGWGRFAHECRPENWVKGPVGNFLVE